MMPVYCFKNSNGEDIESYFSYDDAPKIGDTVEIDGMECTRIPSFILDTSGIERKTHKYPYVSRALPRNLSGVGSYDSQGRPVIRSQSHERDVASRHDMVKE